MRFANFFAAVALALGGSNGAAQSAPAEKTVAIVGATVLPMTGRDRLPDQTVLVSGDRIASTPATAAPKQVYVMRHLQKADGDDPPLSEVGAKLARLLAGQLGNSGIKAVFATPTRRASQTGEPLAQAIGVDVTHYDPRDVPGLVAAVDAVPGNVLVVGHSNTVPDLVAAFGGARPAPLTEEDYGAIYQVTRGSEPVRLLHVPPAPALTAVERGR